MEGEGDDDGDNSVVSPRRQTGTWMKGAEEWPSCNNDSYFMEGINDESRVPLYDSNLEEPEHDEDEGESFQGLGDAERPNVNMSRYDGLAGLGLGDLSCSLLSCGGGGDYDVMQDEVDSAVAEILKRDKIIASLARTLRSVVGQRGDGDNILNSVEQQLRSLAGGLQKSRFLLTSPAPEKMSKDGTTQTEMENEAELEPKKDLRDVGVSTVNENELADTNRNTTNHSLSFDNVSVIPVRDDGEEEEYLNTSRRRQLPPLNGESFRLTFCEYESDPMLEGDSSGHAAASAIEDLKLQVSDSERKLEAAKKYIDEMTHEREQEREDFQKNIIEWKNKFEEAKKEKEKSHNVLEQQQMELNELEDHLRQKEVLEEELVGKLNMTEFELQQAIGKVFELREIIRTLEEQIETTANDVNNFDDAKRDASELGDDDPSSHKGCILSEDPCMSEVDHFEELQEHVDELVKKMEEKLIELETFSWQNRPGSSCSVRSVDDVSVSRRGPEPKPSCDDSVAERDFASRVFCGLRRLECSFDSLVRFEEVLLKKMKEADLKSSNASKKLEELKTENSKLKVDLATCHKKIKDFESFLISNKRAIESSYINESIERLRSAGDQYRQRHVGFEASPIHGRKMNRTTEAQAFPIDNMEEPVFVEPPPSNFVPPPGQQPPPPVQYTQPPGMPPPPPQPTPPGEYYPPPPQPFIPTPEQPVPPPPQQPVPPPPEQPFIPTPEQPVPPPPPQPVPPPPEQPVPPPQEPPPPAEVPPAPPAPPVPEPEVEIIETEIIPKQDLKDPNPCDDAQYERLKNMDCCIEFGKLSVQIEQMRQALEAEKLKSAALENQLRGGPPIQESPPPQQYIPPPQQFVQPPEQFSQPPEQFNPPPEQFYQAPEQFNPPPEQFSQPPEQFNQSPEQFNPPPEQFSQPPEQFNQPPEQFSQPPEQFNQPPEQFYQPPEQFNQPPEQFSQPPEQFYQQPPEQFYQQPPEQFNQPPEQFNQPPEEFIQPPQQTQSPQQFNQPPTEPFIQPPQQTQSPQQFFQPPQQTQSPQFIQPPQQTQSPQQFNQPPTEPFIQPPQQTQSPQQFTQPIQQFAQPPIQQPVFQPAPGPKQPSDGCVGMLPMNDRGDIDQEVAVLQQKIAELQLSECVCKRNLKCAIKKISELRSENEQLRCNIQRLERDLQCYADAFVEDGDCS